MTSVVSAPICPPCIFPPRRTAHEHAAEVSTYRAANPLHLCRAVRPDVERESNPRQPTRNPMRGTGPAMPERPHGHSRASDATRGSYEDGARRRDRAVGHAAMSATADRARKITASQPYAAAIPIPPATLPKIGAATPPTG